MKIILFYITICYSTISYTQNLFEIRLIMSDSSKTVFGHNRFYLRSNEIPENEDTYAPEYQVEILYLDAFELQLRTDSSSAWVVVPDCQRGGSGADFPPMYANYQFLSYNYVNFTKMFLDSTLNFELFKNGKVIEFRFACKYKTNNGNEQLAYTNVEKVYYPAYSTQDSLGLTYLIPVKDDLDYCWSLTGNEEVIEMINQNCQGSVLAEQASLKTAEIRLGNAFQTRNDTIIVTERDYYKSLLRQLSINSKSDYIRYFFR
jgi:hypothetical protein